MLTEKVYYKVNTRVPNDVRVLVSFPLIALKTAQGTSAQTREKHHEQCPLGPHRSSASPKETVAPVGECGGEGDFRRPASARDHHPGSGIPFLARPCWRAPRRPHLYPQKPNLK